MTEPIEVIRQAFEEARVARLLDAIGAARTDGEFAVAWCRWYFDEDGAV